MAYRSIVLDFGVPSNLLVLAIYYSYNLLDEKNCIFGDGIDFDVFRRLSELHWVGEHCWREFSDQIDRE